MDPKLAAIYGTNQPTEADLEKLAAAELAEGLANDDQLDTDGMSDEELEAVAQEVLAAEGGEGGEGEGEGEGEPTDEAQEKLAEADYLGRVMAHSYVKELKEIEKTAGSKMEAAKKAVKGGAMKAGRVAEAIGAKLTPKKMSEGSFKKGKKEIFKKMRSTGMSPSEILKTPGAREAATSAGASREARLHKRVGAGAVGAGGAALAAGGYAAAKKKEGSALDTLVEQRALAILEASGIDPAELEQAQGQEKVADPREALNSAVEQKAWELLGQYGVVPAEQAEEQGQEQE